ncbi:MAG: hypothetical protein MJE77_45575 [Proteobacteria bacterium]|nr:hypothetical protein [Pseudomonadota bacterium]
MNRRVTDANLHPSDNPHYSQGGFTMSELLIAMTVAIIGVSGILSVQLTAFRATSYSRHALEAAVLGEDKMESFRTIPLDEIEDNSERVNARGRPEPDGIFTRTWTIAWNGDRALLTLTVSWVERGDEPHALVFTTERTL